MFGSIKYETADAQTVALVGEYLNDKSTYAYSYIINRRDIDTLERLGYVVKIK